MEDRVVVVDGLVFGEGRAFYEGRGEASALNSVNFGWTMGDTSPPTISDMEAEKTRTDATDNEFRHNESGVRGLVTRERADAEMVAWRSHREREEWILRKNTEKRGNGGDPSRDGNVRDDHKRSRTGRAFASTTNPVRREYTGTAPKCTNYS
ncbi:hypothetical protein Tco_0578997 [Tanacetum coccineum]